MQEKNSKNIRPKKKKGWEIARVDRVALELHFFLFLYVFFLFFFGVFGGGGGLRGFTT